MKASRKFSFSTSWNARRHTNAESLVEEIKSLGFDRIELNFSLPKSIVDGIAGLVRDNKIIVTSVHNFCPLPESLSGQIIYPDHYNLASLNKDTRQKAIELAKMTVDTARSLNAEAVVLHLGRVKMADKTRELALLLKDKSYEAAKTLMDDERRSKIAGHIDSAIKSLGEISAYAKEKNIKLGIENRYYHNEIPSVSDLEIIMKRFSADDNVFYWHDVGHAKAFEYLGLVKKDENLKKFGKRLLGMHIHDIIGIDDHKAPGMGDVDFSGLIKHIKSDTLLVFEIHNTAESADIIKARIDLEKLFLN